MIDRATIQNFADQLKASLGGNDYVFGDECAKERDEMRAAIALIRERVVLKGEG